MLLDTVRVVPLLSAAPPPHPHYVRYAERTFPADAGDAARTPCHSTRISEASASLLRSSPRQRSSVSMCQGHY
jgi:hypothetical protein